MSANIPMAIVTTFYGLMVAHLIFAPLARFIERKSEKEEAERHIREGLTEDELELFDLLKKETLTQDETQRVKLAAKHLLKRLVEEQPKVLIQNWHQSAQTQKQVRAEIERVLDADLPESYDRTTFKQKCDNVYDLAVEYAIRGKKWAV